LVETDTYSNNINVTSKLINETAGEYNYTIVVYDKSGNSGSHTIIIIILPEPIQTTTSTSSSSTTSTSTSSTSTTTSSQTNPSSSSTTIEPSRESDVGNIIGIVLLTSLGLLIGSVGILRLKQKS
jgi:hypothetical protein